MAEKWVLDWLGIPEPERNAANDAAMARANERRAAEVAVIEAAREYMNEVMEPTSHDGYVFMLMALENKFEALDALDAPAWMDETQRVEVE